MTTFLVVFGAVALAAVSVFGLAVLAMWLLAKGRGMP